jgi:hypothetical protein
MQLIVRSISLPVPFIFIKPNFDSIMPAASYIKNDMQRLMETFGSDLNPS